MKVYLSSTSRDLHKHREAVKQALHTARHVVVAMEYYVAASMPPLNKCMDDVGGCELYVGLFGWRYGFIPEGADNPDRRSITELEYRQARRLKIPTLVFLQKPRPEDGPPEDPEDRRRIEALRDDLQGALTVSYFDDPDDLATQVVTAVKLHEEDEERRRRSLLGRLRRASPYLVGPALLLIIGLAARSLLDRNPPAVAQGGLNPPGDATEVAVTTPIQVTFDEPVFGEVRLTLTDAATGRAVSPTLASEPGGRTAIFTLGEHELAFSTTYEAQLEGVRDRAGNRIARPVTWRFTTRQGDRTPPAIVETSPKDGAGNVDIAPTVEARFNEIVGGYQFRLMDAGTGAEVRARATSEGSVAQLVPVDDLAFDREYVAVLSGARDGAGNRMKDECRWTFRTQSLCPLGFHQVAEYLGGPEGRGNYDLLNTRHADQRVVWTGWVVTAIPGGAGYRLRPDNGGSSPLDQAATFLWRSGEPFPNLSGRVTLEGTLVKFSNFGIQVKDARIARASDDQAGP